MLCYFLLYSKVKQIYMSMYPFLFLNLPPIQVTKEQSRIPLLSSKFSLVICFCIYASFCGFCHENVPWLACRRGIWEGQWMTNEGEFSQGYYQDELTTADQFTDSRSTSEPSWDQPTHFGWKEGISGYCLQMVCNAAIADWYRIICPRLAMSEMRKLRLGIYISPSFMKPQILELRILVIIYVKAQTPNCWQTT